ncbi:hypothetical protein AAEX28_09070 [Lentisphaerota bacterium WC36G]|nr:hypothetical protein LJT99_11920 [Lentisphaerae bacterium WC36]
MDKTTTFQDLINKLQTIDFMIFFTSMQFFLTFGVLLVLFFICVFFSFSINRHAIEKKPELCDYRYGYFLALFFGSLSFLGIFCGLISALIFGKFSLITESSLLTQCAAIFLIIINFLKWILIFYRVHTGWILLIVMQMLYLNIPCAIINFLYYSSRSQNLNNSNLKE